MSFARKVFRNTLLFFSSQVWDGIAAAIVLVLLTRYLGPDRFGHYATAFAIVNLVIPLTFMGLHEVGIRELARRKTPEEKGACLGGLIRARFILLAVGALVTFGILAVATPALPVIIATLIFYAAMAVGSSGELAVAAFIAEERFEFNLYVLVTERLSLLLALGAVVALDLGFYAAIVCFIVSKCAKAYAAFHHLRRHFFPLDMHGELRWILDPLKESYMVGLGMIAGMGFYHLIVIMMSELVNARAAGMLNAYFTPIIRAQMLGVALGRSLMPRLALESGRDRKAFHMITGRGLLITFGAGAFAAAVLWPLRHWIIATFFGEEFMTGVDAFGCLILLLPIVFIDNVLNVALITDGKSRSFFACRALGFAVGVSTTLLLLDRWDMGFYAGVFGIIAGRAVGALSMVLLLSTPPGSGPRPAPPPERGPRRAPGPGALVEGCTG